MDIKIIFGLVLVFIICIFSIISSLDNKINKIEKNLEEIMKKLGTPDNNLTEEFDNELLELVSQGKIVKAIKKYRMATGEGLQEANEYIEALEENQGSDSSEETNNSDKL